MSNLSSSRGHILERFDRILGYLSNIDKVSDHDKGWERERERNRDGDIDRDRDRDRDRYQQRYR